MSKLNLEKVMITPEEEYVQYYAEIKKIILGCRGVQSRQIYWEEAVAQIAVLFVNKLQAERDTGQHKDIKQLQRMVENRDFLIKWLKENIDKFYSGDY